MPLKGVRGHTSVRLKAMHAADAQRAPLSPTHVIGNMRDFLAEPAVTDALGQRIPVRLHPEQVRELLKDRSVQLTANGEHITIVPATSSGEPNPSGGEPVAMSYAMRVDPANAKLNSADRLRALRALDRHWEMIAPVDEEGVSNSVVSSPQLGFSMFPTGRPGSCSATHEAHC